MAIEEPQTDTPASPKRVTVLCRDFAPAALDYHRRSMREKGYRLEGAITPRQVQMIDGPGHTEVLFDGQLLYAATFVKDD